jgi:uncharacterized membrane protein
VIMTLKRFVVTILLWWLGFVGLSLLHFNPGGLLNIVGFPFIVLVPGYITVVLLRLGHQPFITKLLFAVGLSLIEVLAVALLGNTLLPHIGLARPLDQGVLLAELSLLVFAQLALLIMRTKKRARQVVDDAIRLRFIVPDNLNAVFAITPFIFVILSIMGAITLNNGGSNGFTVAMLVGMVIYFGAMLCCMRRLQEGTLLIGIVTTALSLLLMTSLRGWYTTGHDIQREFHVFMLTQQAGLWSMDHLRDAYNACLSITILPTIFHNLLSLGAGYIYEVFFQFLFALTPAVVFLIGRRFTTKFIALMATILFMAFPAFYGDMPMLNRQEIAFLFLSIALLSIFTEGLSLRNKKIIFYAMSLGIVVSHYSTNYTFIAILVVFLGTQAILRSLAAVCKNGRVDRWLNLKIWRKKEKNVITVVATVGLIAMSFLWSVQLTHTADDSLVKVTKETVQNIALALKNESVSQKNRYSYVELNKLSEQDKLESYFHQSTELSRRKYGAEQLYDPTTYDGYSYRVHDDQPAPLTDLGKFVNRLGVPVNLLSEGPRLGNADVRQDISRLLQILIIVGVAILFLNKRYNNHITNEYRLLQFSSISLLIAMIAVPVLSAAYGLSRAFLQVLIIACVPLVIGLLAFFPRRFKKVGREAVIVVVLLFFISLTGLPTGILGGYTPQLHLFNAGKYYDMYFTHDSEVASADWLHQLVTTKDKHADVQADQVFIDRYTNLGVHGAHGTLGTLDDAYPGLIRKDSYVYLGYTATVKHEANIFYNGDTITYEYPVEFLDQQKNLIYSNGGSEIYR